MCHILTLPPFCRGGGGGAVGGGLVTRVRQCSNEKKNEISRVSEVPYIQHCSARTQTVHEEQLCNHLQNYYF